MPDYPYVNHMNILFKGLEKFDIPSLVQKCTDQWYNQTLCKVNDTVLRLGIVKGEYHWHKHDDNDELFFVLNGELELDVDGKETIILREQQGYTVPKKIMHRTRAKERTVILMIENYGIIPTGDA